MWLLSSLSSVYILRSLSKQAILYMYVRSYSLAVLRLVLEILLMTSRSSFVLIFFSIFHPKCGTVKPPTCSINQIYNMLNLLFLSTFVSGSRNSSDSLQASVDCLYSVLCSIYSGVVTVKPSRHTVCQESRISVWFQCLSSGTVCETCPAFIFHSLSVCRAVL